MEFIIKEIIKGSIILAFIYGLSYIIELNSRWKLLIFFFKLKKNVLEAEGHANVNAELYFIICLLTLLFDKYNNDFLPADYAFWKWLIIMLPLAIIFRMIYFWLTPKDPNRADDDYSV